MFEFHGWAVVELPEDDTPEGIILISRGGRSQAIKQVRAKINEVHDEFSLFEVRRSGNDLIVIIAHGLRNHRYEPVIELFDWVAQEFPLAYGLLYVQDDEDSEREEDYSEQFHVWRLARGHLEELPDTLLSPRIPVIEPPHEED